MILEEALYTHLTSHPGVSALVGTRVYPVTLPQNVAYPAISYMRVSGGADYAHDGASGLDNPRVQFSCWAKKYEDAKAVAKQVRAAFATAPGSVGTVSIQAAIVEDEIDMFEAAPAVYQVVVDVSFWVREG